MAGNAQRNWINEDLEAAVSAVKSDKISLRRAEYVYGVLKSTVAFYLSQMLTGTVATNQVNYLLLNKTKLTVPVLC